MNIGRRTWLAWFAGGLWGFCMALEWVLIITPNPYRLIVPVEQAGLWQGMARLVPAIDKLVQLSQVGQWLALLMLLLQVVESSGLLGHLRRSPAVSWGRTWAVLGGGGVLLGATAAMVNPFDGNRIRESVPFLVAIGVATVAFVGCLEWVRWFNPRLFRGLSWAPGKPLGQVLCAVCVAGCAATGYLGLFYGYLGLMRYDSDYLYRLILVLGVVGFTVAATVLPALAVGTYIGWLDVLATPRPAAGFLMWTVILALSLSAGGHAMATRYALTTGLAQGVGLETGAASPWTAATLLGENRMEIWSSKAGSTWCTPENIERIERYIHRPQETLLTRPALSLLVDAALLDWDRNEACRRLLDGSAHTRDCLIDVMVASRLTGTNTPHLRDMFDTLADSSRFTVLGPGGAASIAQGYQRLGLSEQADAWYARAQDGGMKADVVAADRQEAVSHPTGVVKGRVLLDGHPLGGVKVMIKHHDWSPADVEGRMRGLWEDLGGLNELPSTEARYANLGALRKMGDVVQTDGDGSFALSGVEQGNVVVAVRVPGVYTSLTLAQPLPPLQLNGPLLDVGTVDLRR